MSDKEILINAVTGYKERYYRATSDNQRSSAYYRALGMLKLALLLNVIDYDEWCQLSDEIIDWV